jgi:AcrR family transcriptional regulator
MTRFTRSDWLAVGLAVLGREGPDALVLEALCQRARRTRGSFYHHFDSIDEFIAELAAHWRQTHTLDLIAKADGRRTPRERLDHLNSLAVALDPRIEQGVRRLAARHAAVEAVCHTVDAERVAYLARLYEASGRYSSAQALALARIEYAAFVGLQIVAPDARPKELRALYESFLALTGRMSTTRTA